MQQYYDYYNSVVNYMTVENNTKYSNKIIDAYEEKRKEDTKE